MKTIPPHELLDTAIRAAEAAGLHALENKARRIETTEIFAHDIKLVLDMECQRVAEEMIAREYPDHTIIGEEDSARQSNSPYEWIIDPIDGTVNFSHGYPNWCSSVAVRLEDQMVAGCVFAPESGECFTAYREGPAQCNGQPIAVSAIRNLRDAVILTGLTKHFEREQDRQFEAFRKLALKTQKLRISGSAALDLCRVAAGQCDGYFENGIYLWDHAAAGLIAQQAGARVILYPHSNPELGTGIICANEHLIDGLRSLYEEVLQD